MLKNLNINQLHKFVEYVDKLNELKTNLLILISSNMEHYTNERDAKIRNLENTIINIEYLKENIR